MMLKLCSEQLKLYSSVKEAPVDWLWYPYIPFGKVTIIQGDPGGGKSTLMMNIIAAVSNGNINGNINQSGQKLRKPMHVIYQCSEDDTADTIKPRLIKAGANCDNVAFLDEELESLTLNDEKLRRAVADFNAKLLVIDPFQAYLGDTDFSNVSSIRKALKQLSMWASAYDCAIILVSHLNKKQSSKAMYRGLGSIDIVAAARSVLHLEKNDDSDIRVLKHIKSSLAPRGKDLFFTIEEETGVKWLDMNSTNESVEVVTIAEKLSKQEQAAQALQIMLQEGPMKASEIKDSFDGKISERALMDVKKFLCIESFRKSGIWYWKLPK